MQDLQDETICIYHLDKYWIKYPASMKVTCFEEEWYYGIIFHVERGDYEIIHNYAMDTQRLIINEKAPTGAKGCQDIPFKPATFVFLPEGITVREDLQ
jgi:hypothetical protein